MNLFVVNVSDENTENGFTLLKRKRTKTRFIKGGTLRVQRDVLK
jgi:hypothetical protein